MTHLEVHPFDDNNALADALAQSLRQDLEKSIARCGHASLLVSGGRSPVPLFEKLSQTKLDWSKVTLSLVDERWVPETDPNSNAALVKKHLLINHASVARFIPLYTGEASARIAENTLRDIMDELPLPLTAVILGMGDDGHTASLFPGSEQLLEGLALGKTRENTPPCLAQTGSAHPVERISFTLPWILEAERIYLQFGGAGKAAVFEKARTAPSHDFPVSHVLHQNRTPVLVYASTH